jgi:hypothetical protein
MTGALREDVDNRPATLSQETMAEGLNKAVKSNDSNFPPEWRLSRGGREESASG